MVFERYSTDCPVVSVETNRPTHFAKVIVTSTKGFVGPGS